MRCVFCVGLNVAKEANTRRALIARPFLHDLRRVAQPIAIARHKGQHGDANRCQGLRPGKGVANPEGGKGGTGEGEGGRHKGEGR